MFSAKQSKPSPIQISKSLLCRKKFIKYKGHNEGVYKSHLFGGPCIITCSPEMNKFVLGSQGDGLAFLAGWPNPEVMGLTCMAILDGPSHKRMRRLILESVNHPMALKKALIRLKIRFTSVLAQWAKEKTITLRQKLKTVAFEDICDSFLSMKPGPLTKKMESFMDGLVGGMRAYPINIPGFSYHSALQSRKNLVNIMTSIVQHRRQENRVGEVEDFLDVLLKTCDEKGNPLTNAEVCDNIIAFLLAGHESTSYTIIWAMVLLAKNPHILSKLRAEHMSLQKKNEDLLLHDFKNLPFTNYVLNEVLRLVNISPFVFRTVGQDDVHHQGYYFPKGWKVVAWTRASHMSPTNFSDPQKFSPERFQDTSTQSGQYMPFGYGPRTCPGNMLALLSSRLFLHILMTNYKWELLNPDGEVAYLPHPKLEDGGKILFEHI